MTADKMKSILIDFIKNYDASEKAGFVARPGYVKVTVPAELREACMSAVARVGMEFRKATRSDYNYPESLYFAIGYDDITINSIKDHSGIEYLLQNALKKEERKLICMRFKDRATLEQCGAEFRVTRQRIRDIEGRALRKLRSKSAQKIILGGEGAAHNYEQAKAQLAASAEELSTAAEKIKARTMYLKSIENTEKAAMEAGSAIEDLQSNYMMDISELKLSTRCYNSLKRAGYNRVADFAGLTMDALLLVRGIGRKGAEEIAGKLRNFGIILSETDCRVGQPEGEPSHI